jgi:chemotaxis protein CheX
MRAKITVAEAANSLVAAPEVHRPDLVEPIVEGASLVLQKECGGTVRRGDAHRVRSPQTTSDYCALVAITGSVSGLVAYSMSETMAREIAGRLIGEPVAEMDALAQSAIAELANMITGQAGICLERNGFPSDMSPPILLVGHGSAIATFNLTRTVVPLVLSFGELHIDIALREV